MPPGHPCRNPQVLLRVGGPETFSGTCKWDDKPVGLRQWRESVPVGIGSQTSCISRTCPRVLLRTVSAPQACAHLFSNAGILNTSVCSLLVHTGFILQRGDPDPAPGGARGTRRRQRASPRRRWRLWGLRSAVARGAQWACSLQWQRTSKCRAAGESGASAETTT